MCLFKKKEVVITESPAEIERKERIKALSEKFKLGEMFNYLGVECKVKKTSSLIYGLYSCYPYAELKADYVDKNGVIHTITLTHEEAMRIGL